MCGSKIIHYLKNWYINLIQRWYFILLCTFFPLFFVLMNLYCLTFLRSYYTSSLLNSASVKRIFSAHNQNVSSSLVSESVCMIKVYYDDLYYTVVAESASLTPDALLGLIGGQVGLFIGVSVMTVFEVVEFWIVVFTELIFLMQQRKQINTTPWSKNFLFCAILVFFFNFNK